MLSSLDPSQIAQAIANGDVKTIQSVKGIGLKLPSACDLRDKILQVLEDPQISVLPSNRKGRKRYHWKLWDICANRLRGGG
jgi:Holliday junction DNA helicase RuvA